MSETGSQTAEMPLIIGTFLLVRGDGSAERLPGVRRGTRACVIRAPAQHGRRTGGGRRPYPRHVTEPASLPGRKADHLRIAAQPGVLHTRGAGLDALRLRHRALPGRDLADVSLTTTLFGHTLAAP